jgi:hypothetical protein
MKKDPHVRYPNDPGPLVPGRTDLRYTVLPGDDHDVVRIRQDIQEEGRGLFVFEMGGTGVRCLCEAYYPEDIRATYARRSLSKGSKADMEMGRLVVINELFQWVGEITTPMLTEIRRNNRAVHSHLKRSYDEQAHIKAMNDAEEERVAPAHEEFADFYAEAMKDTMQFGMGKVNVSQYSGGSK